MNDNLENHELLELVARYIIGSYELAEIIYTLHVFGYPGALPREASVPLEKNIRSLESLSEDVGMNDSDTFKLLSKTLDAFRLVLENDKNMKDWVEGFTGKPMSKIRKTSKLSIQTLESKGGFTGKSSLPFWTSDEIYRAFLENSSRLMNDLRSHVNAFFIRARSISNGFIKNWVEEQRIKGRFNYTN